MVAVALVAAAAGGFLLAGSGDEGSSAGKGAASQAGGGSAPPPDQPEPTGGGTSAGGLELTAYSPGDPFYSYRARVPTGTGWTTPVEEELTPGALLQTTVRGPKGIVLIIDRTPSEKPKLGGSFDSRRTVPQPAFGSMEQYVFSNSEVFPECAGITCVDYLIDDGSGGGWGVLGGGGTDFALAQEVAAEVANSIRF